MGAAFRLGLLAAGALLLLSGPAAANSCTLSATAVTFGNYNVFKTSATLVNGSVSFKCTVSAAITIQLNKGSSSSFNPRTMKLTTNVLDYNLYLNAALTTIWGDGTGGSSTYSNSAPGTGTVTVTVYGSIPALQNVPSGSYSDTITATITF